MTQAKTGSGSEIGLHLNLRRACCEKLERDLRSTSDLLIRSVSLINDITDDTTCCTR
jgi:hypothetical protein